MSDDSFLAAARETYVRANAGTLAWMLERPVLHGAFLNTKQNSLTLADYGEADGWRGPQFTYGWIQGRGLEALVMHARFFAEHDPALAVRLDDAARRLYARLSELMARFGHVYFCYDASMTPVRPGAGGQAVIQSRPDDLFTYSDVFTLKGLIAASHRYDPGATAQHVERLHDLVSAIEEGRFIMDERQPLDRGALAAQPDEYGPRMIVLGAAALLHQLGLGPEAAFGERFISHVLDHHWDGRSGSSGLVRDRPGGDHSNPGHAIEFVGFALEVLPVDADPALVGDLIAILIASFEAGFQGPGICLSVTVPEGRPLSPYFPWWSLPEAIRAAARAYQRTRDRRLLDIWRRAHDAFFASYWRERPPIAFQTRTREGPFDYVPATPDLDPGYHTGLSLLGAIEAIAGLRGVEASRSAG